ncbi:auxilin-related protein 2-like [Lycium barbarum]|uniref:auxilin-related protein 2-like n=1 Tax=Lycium barbarum TaxID=112863 RepID=UPI00293E0706|nr:auxilin-related protein 2-like [Lycium barbarum]
MDDLDVLARDFGFRPAGKSAPMRSDGGDQRRSSSVRSTSTSSPLYDDDMFGVPPKYTKPSNNSNSNKSSSMNDINYDSIFNNNNKTSSVPVYDKPVYDDEGDIFDGLPGLKSKSVSEKSSVRFDDDVFIATMTSPSEAKIKDEHFGDLLGNLKSNEKVTESKSSSSSSAREFDDLLAGFGNSTSTTNKRSYTESSHYSKPTGNSNRSSSVLDDPFAGLGSTSMPASSSPGEFIDPLEQIGQLGKSGNAKSEASSVSGGVLDDLDPLNGFSKSVPPLYPARNNRGMEGSPQRAGSGRSDTQTSTSRENIGKSSSRSSDSRSEKKVPGDGFQDSPLFDMPSADPLRSFGQAGSSPYASNNIHETNFGSDTSPRSEEQMQPSDDVWLSVSEIPLFTQPTRAPPPSRPPPPIPQQNFKSEASSFASNARKKGDGYSSSPSYNQYSQSPKLVRPAAKSPPISQLDELDEFAMGRSHHSVDESADDVSGEDMNANSVAAASAAAMKDAMDRAQAKFRHAKEVREREFAKAAKSKEAVNLDRDEQAMRESQEKELRENKERLERECQQREKEEEERAQWKLERERQRAREIERDRGRQAVERATREARERAGADARDRAAAAARLKTERASVEKASAEARERAERAAVQRAQAEARERAAAEARERAEKVAAEAREKEAREKASAAKAEAEARRRAERAAVERAAAEARQRAAAEARERAAAAARMNQQKNDDDLESFFNMGSRANSAPKTRASSSETSSASQFQNKAGAGGPKPTFSSTTTSSNRTKASSTTSFVDDLSSIFGAATSSGDFQEVEGETEERRRARLERHQRTQDRAAKALAEKNQRDLQVQMEQQERNRIGETLDIEIKRWAAGKEGNLRALLSTLQYVLWPECGWQPVSLTDLITGASVKKVYRKATLCIHPDKVQQKGATLQQKYVAEKVFDMLKEAWNKFNSEELF